MTEEKQKEHWVNKKWRPAMAWMYMIVCIFDFIIAPIMWSILQALHKGNVTEQWVPLTLQGAGLFHMAMGAIVGVAVWSRGKEKLAGVDTETSMRPTRYRQTYERDEIEPDYGRENAADYRDRLSSNSARES